MNLLLTFQFYHNLVRSYIFLCKEKSRNNAGCGVLQTPIK
ncbi:MAG: olfactory receptor 4F15 [Firmicutes bacterium HGW-Firmicutes-3]|nr:MAG: olfactory receptor 4F15 [Firmicutes bacterium HGW-Firmicutes-3]